MVTTTTAQASPLHSPAFWFIYSATGPFLPNGRLVKSRVGPEMKQDLLLFSWSWRPGVAVDLLASSLVDVDFLNLAAVDVDAKGGGCYWRHRG
ncbi:hypothetical protein Taro_028935 [Colocasia esculenta]|uniref:Uncharacterized protein n=1 Tax=Colocasia esculenta TaxID=4460 RepID=A0A843VJX1_COLES|nr:hypothetical protein [Colocasia esculenta]